ncbi:MAG: HNH endonuclease [Anaerolineae bacterium]|nr:HNH endonuclease [Anaerolineae bacterium]
MATYLLTWNPNRWEWDDIQKEKRFLQEEGLSPGRWSCGNTKRIRPNDRVFVMRLGKEPRGVFASGIVDSEPYFDAHWNSESKHRDTLYIDILFDTLLDPEHDEILSRALLDEAPFSEMNWSPQRSGVHIPDDIAIQLEATWANLINRSHVDLPEEIVGPQHYVEGATRQKMVNAYERNRAARERCIAHYGAVCSVCGFDFPEKYGPVGNKIIDVHHLIPLSEIRQGHVVDPIRHLRPVCPNCHAVIHKRTPPYTIKEVKVFISENEKRS